MALAAILSGRLPHTVTWWRVTGPNGFGGDSVDSPVLIEGRWEERQETFYGAIDRRELVSKAVVYVDRDMSVGDYLCLENKADQTDPTVVSGAMKIQRFDKMPDLRNLDAVRRAVL
jgi:hypothetical protein